MDTANIAALVILVITGIMIFFGVRSWWPIKTIPKAKSGPSATTTVGVSGGAAATVATPPTTIPPIPAPVPVAVPRSTNWLGWVLIIGLVVGVIYLVKTKDSSRQVSAPAPQGRQQAPLKNFSARIDPLRYNKQKSRGVRKENVDGGTTIIIDPGGELVYDINIPGILEEKTVFIDFHRRETESQYVGYRVNEIRHKHIFLKAAGSHDSRYGTDSREFHVGENEIAFFSEGGRININGDENIVVYQR